MAILRCPKSECRQRFSWDVSKGFPRFCAMCGADIACVDDDAVVMPNILTFRSKAVDAPMRAYMDGSEKRVDMAAELAGTTREEMSSIKVTDISDRQDVQAAQPVNNAVTQFMAANPGVGGMNPNGAEYSTQVQTGPFPNVGAKMLTKTREHHGKISMGSAVSDRPALETQQPGYRRRG